MDKTTYTRVWVNRTSVDVQVILSQHLWSLVDSPSGSIKDATKHVLRDTQLQTLSRELDSSLCGVSNKFRLWRGELANLLHIDSRCAFEYLYLGQYCSRSKLQNSIPAQQL